MERSASAICKIKSEVVKEIVIDGKKNIQGSYILQYEGELRGTGILANLPNEKDDKIYGIERFSGMLGEKRGDFILESTADYENGSVKILKTVVAGSGTHDFSCLRGVIEVVSEHDFFKVIFTYYFESQLK